MNARASAVPLPAGMSVLARLTSTCVLRSAAVLGSGTTPGTRSDPPHATRSTRIKTWAVSRTFVVIVPTVIRDTSHEFVVILPRIW